MNEGVEDYGDPLDLTPFNYGAVVTIDKTGSVAAYDDAVVTTLWDVDTILLDTWYELSIRYKTSTSTYRVALDGTYNNTVLAFRTAAGPIDNELNSVGILTKAASLYVDKISVAAIPEPSSFVLLCCGLIGLFGLRGRRRRAA